ncbi:MAG: hypothetical protein JWP34_549 [Massilia sp.]|nr:hypothetical protein [Massilia sp.]
MKTLPTLLLVTAVAVGAAFGSAPVWAAAAAPAPVAKAKNWTPPAYRIHAQKLTEQIMAKHPELISATFHGVPPGMDKVYTMFAGSLLERIGNPDDPDDIDVITKGITIVDPRWHRTNDAVKKFVMMLPLRDKANESVGLLVLAYKANSAKSELDFFKASSALRDSLRKDIPSYESLFEQAR